MRFTQAPVTMKTMKGTFREGLHVALDDLMNDVESKPEAANGGMVQFVAEDPPYHHVISLAVTIITETISNPNSN